MRPVLECNGYLGLIVIGGRREKEIIEGIRINPVVKRRTFLNRGVRVCGNRLNDAR